MLKTTTPNGLQTSTLQNQTLVCIHPKWLESPHFLQPDYRITLKGVNVKKIYQSRRLPQVSNVPGNFQVVQKEFLPR